MKSEKWGQKNETQEIRSSPLPARKAVCKKEGSGDKNVFFPSF
jgi:hypothetical protein